MHDFFVGEYADNPQPSSFVEANKYWDNWSLDALTTPRINSFFDQVERLPDVRLTGFRQQVLDTPVYYDSQSSAGWYHASCNATPTAITAAPTALTPTPPRARTPTISSLCRGRFSTGSTSRRASAGG